VRGTEFDGDRGVEQAGRDSDAGVPRSPNSSASMVVALRLTIVIAWATASMLRRSPAE
jgi:hypothetical protein